MTVEPRTPVTYSGIRLLVELSESPLPGAKYAHDVVSRRLVHIESEARAAALREVAERLERKWRGTEYGKYAWRDVRTVLDILTEATDTSAVGASE